MFKLIVWCLLKQSYKCKIVSLLCLCGTKLGIVKLILQTTGSVSLLVDDSFVPEDIISSVSVPKC